MSNEYLPIVLWALQQQNQKIESDYKIELERVADTLKEINHTLYLQALPPDERAKVIAMEREVEEQQRRAQREENEQLFSSIKKLFQDSEWHTAAEVTNKFNISMQKACAILNSFIEQGYIEKIVITKFSRRSMDKALYKELKQKGFCRGQSYRIYRMKKDTQ